MVSVSVGRREEEKMKVGPIRRQNNGETVLINIEHPLMKEDQKRAQAQDKRSRHITAINKT